MVFLGWRKQRGNRAREDVFQLGGFEGVGVLALLQLNKGAFFPFPILHYPSLQSLSLFEFTIFSLMKLSSSVSLVSKQVSSYCPWNLMEHLENRSFGGIPTGIGIPLCHHRADHERHCYQE